MKRACLSAWIATLSLGGCSPWFQVDTVVELESGANPTVIFDVPVPDAPPVLKTFELNIPQIHPGIFPTLGGQELCRGAADGDPAPSPLPKPQPIYLKHQSGPERIPQTAQRCRQDSKTGEVELYPDFTAALESAPNGLVLEKTKERALRILFAEEVLPKDANNETIADIDRQIVVRHQRASLRPSAGADTTSTELSRSDEVMVYTTLVRRVGPYSVDGPGSRIALAESSNQRTEGFVRSWRSASHPTEVKARFTPAQVRAEIEKQVLATRPQNTVRILKIEIAYYDGNGGLLQPVYRFVVEQTPHASQLGLPQHLVGFLPYAITNEPVPELSNPGRARMLAKNLHEMQAPTAEKPVLLGTYITRNDSEHWVNDALGFLTEMRGSSAGSAYSVSQFVPATPSKFTTESAEYVNSVHLALVEAHGRPWAIATKGRGAEPVFFSPVGRSSLDTVRLGPGLPKGNLRHLVLHSCDVIFSPDETPLWADPWWTVFQGLTSVVGYRTSMYIDDGAGVAFGRSLAGGASVLAAWFNSVSSLNAYGREPSLRFSCDGDQTMGRPAAISVCGTANATLADISNPASATPVTCLDAWWVGDSNSPL